MGALTLSKACLKWSKFIPMVTLFTLSVNNRFIRKVCYGRSMQDEPIIRYGYLALLIIEYSAQYIH